VQFSLSIHGVGVSRAASQDTKQRHGLADRAPESLSRLLDTGQRPARRGRKDCLAVGRREDRRPTGSAGLSAWVRIPGTQY